MKKQLLIPILLTFCSYHANAQFRVDQVDNSGYAKGQNNLVNSVPLTTTIVGNGLYAAPNNVFIGKNTGTSSIYAPSDPTGNDGTGNTFVGYNCGTANLNGIANSFFGMWSGVSNTTGRGNTFLGMWCGPANTDGSHNTMVGQGAGQVSTTGHDNVFVGQGAAINNTTGGHNVFLGRTAGTGNTSGVDNIAIGYDAGFTSGGFTNATAIGANARASANNAMILGQTGANAVDVGLGTSTPAVGVHLHTKNVNRPEVVKFETTDVSSSSASTLNLVTTGTFPFPSSNFNLAMNGAANTSTFLLPLGALAPALPYTNMATMLTDGKNMAIGKNSNEYPGSIHFINSVAGSLRECMRINPNAYVGINTRASAQTSGTGEPQALFHVNIANSPDGNANSLTNRLIHGIRFEGLPPSEPRHTDAVVIDPVTGDLARSTSGGGPGNDWHLTGNLTTGTEFIGTLAGTFDDFRIRTDGNPVARFTWQGGNFVLGATNIFPAGSTVTAIVGTSNRPDVAANSILVGNENEIEQSSNSGVIGDENFVHSDNALATGVRNFIRPGSNASVVLGTANEIDASNYSFASGYFNKVLNSNSSQAIGSNNVVSTTSANAIAAGEDNDITNGTAVAAIGAHNVINNSNESVIAGEWNVMDDCHGCFIGGGHNSAVDWYNFIGGEHNTAVGKNNVLIGNWLETTTALMVPHSNSNPNIMMIGNQINSDLHNSLTVGFENNRTMVTDKTGVAIQLNPTTAGTRAPTVNFEVNASPTGAAPLPPCPLNSNIRFHNLPPDPQYNTRKLPVVLIDPATGELFQSTITSANKSGDNSSEDITKLQKENEDLKNRLSQLESMLSKYDDKFAQLEKSIYQICETGCAGLNTHLSDDLYQSIPNPSSTEANIGYYLANNYSNASIQLINIEGKVVRTFNLNPSRGNGSINVPLSELQAGVYMYKLVVDGKQIGAKKLQKQ